VKKNESGSLEPDLLVVAVVTVLSGEVTAAGSLGFITTARFTIN